MPTYFFVFGRDEQLSLMELFAYCESRAIFIEIVQHQGQAAILESENQLDLNRMVRDLGGTVKAGNVLVDCSAEDLVEEMKRVDWSETVPKKFFYSISDYSGKGEENPPLEIMQQSLKAQFKKERLKGVLKWPKDRDSEFIGTTPTQLKKQKQVEQGLDLLLLEVGDHVWIGKTVIVSNPKDWAERDQQKPSKKEFVQTSIRLSKMLLNLSGAKPGNTVLDPFCGTGSVLMEGMLLGCHAIGADLDPAMVSSAKQNLQWIQKSNRLDSQFAVLQGDARNVGNAMHHRILDCVVTEPELGPYWRGKPNPIEAKNIIQKLEAMYNEFFRELRKVMKSRQRVVIVLPEIPTRDGKKHNISDRVFASNGFREWTPTHALLRNKLPYDYRAKNSLIVRKVHVLEKT